MPETKELPMEKPVAVRLNDEELIGKGEKLARLLGVKQSLEAKKKADAKATQADIDNLDVEIAELAEVVRVGFENRKQGTLFVDKKALAAVEKRSVETPGEIAPA